jgi:hypothetical protein
MAAQRAAQSLKSGAQGTVPRTQPAVTTTPAVRAVHTPPVPETSPWEEVPFPEDTTATNENIAVWVNREDGIVRIEFGIRDGARFEDDMITELPDGGDVMYWTKTNSEMFATLGGEFKIPGSLIRVTLNAFRSLKDQETLAYMAAHNGQLPPEKPRSNGSQTRFARPTTR